MAGSFAVSSRIGSGSRAGPGAVRRWPMPLVTGVALIAALLAWMIGNPWGSLGDGTRSGPAPGLTGVWHIERIGHGESVASTVSPLAGQTLVLERQQVTLGVAPKAVVSAVTYLHFEDGSTVLRLDSAVTAALGSGEAPVTAELIDSKTLVLRAGSLHFDLRREALK